MTVLNKINILYASKYMHTISENDGSFLLVTQNMVRLHMPLLFVHAIKPSKRSIKYVYTH